MTLKLVLGIISACTSFLAIVVRVGRSGSGRDALIALARDQGWTYTLADPSLPSAWSSGRLGRPLPFPELPFTWGTASDVITGPCGTLCFTAFTSTTTTTLADMSTRDVYHGVVALRLPLPLPDVSVAYEPTYGDYWVRSGSPEFVRALLTPDMVGWLRAPGRRSRPFVIVGSDLITWRDGPLRGTDDVLSLLTELTEFVTHVSNDIGVLWDTSRGLPRAVQDEVEA